MIEDFNCPSCGRPVTGARDLRCERCEKASKPVLHPNKFQQRKRYYQRERLKNTAPEMRDCIIDVLKFMHDPKQLARVLPVWYRTHKPLIEYLGYGDLEGPSKSEQHHPGSTQLGDLSTSIPRRRPSRSYRKRAPV